MEQELEKKEEPDRKDKKKNKIEELKCTKCGSHQVYTTLSERVCRRCGYRENLYAGVKEGK